MKYLITISMLGLIAFFTMLSLLRSRPSISKAPPSVPISHAGSRITPGEKPPFTEPGELINPVQFVQDRMTGGTGLLVTANSKGLQVVGVMKGSPAEAAGIEVGDVIVSVDGVVTKGVPLKDASKSIQGPLGSTVTLDLSKADLTTTRVILTRKQIRELRSLPVTVGS